MVDIPEYERDDSQDYLEVLEALDEIPFPLGKTLLCSFLKADFSNKSIEKNKLYDIDGFGVFVDFTKDKIMELIDKCLINSFVEIKGSDFNKFIRVMELSSKGIRELKNPSLGKKIEFEKGEEVSDRELEAFKELEEFLRGFNMEQKKAIISKKKEILCVAGAGSGKTTVLTKRVQFINKYDKVRGDEILAITFTRKAREEMQRRLGLLKVKARVETFNSFCEKILLKYGGKVYGRKVRVISYQQKIMIFMQSLDYIGLTAQEAIDKYFKLNQKKNKSFSQLQNILMNDCFSVLDYYKAQGKDVNVLNGNKLNGDYKMISEIVRFLQKQMEIQGLRTYSDQIMDAIGFFKKNPGLIPKFQHVLIDEYQDVNASQIEIIDLINPDNLFCVGDPRQAIFGWRGSDIEYILNFRKKYPDSQLIHLIKNYRSSRHIVEFMNKTIEKMELPDLDASYVGERSLELKGFDSELEEYKFILETIAESDLEYKEIFILARTNKKLEEIASLMKKTSIPFILKNDDNPNVESSGEVTLATIHSIKGLEAEMVFVIGANGINFPCKASEHPVMEEIKMYEYDKEEEERRLFYVAVSRARNRLYLTYTGKKPSYFIDEGDFY
jgi:superfamily I DNA/RNA helicase